MRSGSYGVLLLVVVSFAMNVTFTHRICAEEKQWTTNKEDLKPQLKPAKIEQGDSEPLKLRKQRYNSAIDAVAFYMQRLPGDHDPIPYIVAAQERMVSAGLEMETNPKKRIAILEEAVRLAKITEMLTPQHYVEGKSKRLFCQAYASSARANVEIQLLKEKETKPR